MIHRDKHILDAFATITVNFGAIIKELQTKEPDINFVAYQLNYTVQVLNEYIPVIFDKDAKAKVIPLKVIRGGK